MGEYSVVTDFDWGSGKGSQRETKALSGEKSPECTGGKWGG